MYKIWGKVRKHNQRGRTLGFPTANINLTEKIPEGIYISKTKIGDKQYNSLTFVGRAETFRETNVHAETYILDFSKDIYGEQISVKLLKKIRDNKKFNSPNELVEQMKQDESEARRYFLR